MRELKFIVDGGFGAPSEHVEDFEVVMLVGAGIGITPFAAITKDLYLKRQMVCSYPNMSIAIHCDGQGTSMKLKHVYLFWLNREQEAFEWFSKQLHGMIHPCAN
ncbi:MAG: hypothetical protein JSR69_09085 [Proteobacteria bacterium]|nr:hypothetical protein [Pseudomonadota bacterium]